MQQCASTKLQDRPVVYRPNKIAGDFLKTQLRPGSAKANSDLVHLVLIKKRSLQIAARALLHVLARLPKRDKTMVVAVRVGVVADDDFVIVDVGNYGGRGTRKINPYVTTIAQQEPVS